MSQFICHEPARIDNDEHPQAVSNSEGEQSRTTLAVTVLKFRMLSKSACVFSGEGTRVKGESYMERRLANSGRGWQHSKCPASLQVQPSRLRPIRVMC